MTSIRRLPSGHANLESSVRDLLANLRASHDADTAEVLAKATNVYLEAILRFRSTSVFTASDVVALFGIWEALLNVTKSTPTVSEFAPKRSEAEVVQAGEDHPAD